MILMIDNYDSFVYNLVQYLKMLGEDVVVKRNDELTIDQIRILDPEMIVLSPGPCTPSDAGIVLQVIDELKGSYPILGICLGHQAIAQAFGGNVIKGKEPVHGKVFQITHDGKGVFQGLKTPLNVTRYHSLIVEKESLPDTLEISSITSDGVIMGIRHKGFKIEGVQFHPEAILSEGGMEMLRNFLNQVRGSNDHN